MSLMAELGEGPPPPKQERNEGGGGGRPAWQVGTNLLFVWQFHSKGETSFPMSFGYQGQLRIYYKGSKSLTQCQVALLV